jgi:hypothetical protein
LFFTLGYAPSMLCGRERLEAGNPKAGNFEAGKLGACEVGL